MNQLYHITNIVWDTDGADVELPTECVIDADTQEVEEDPQLFADTLSDHYGWCISSLKAEEIPDEFPDEDLQRYLSLPQLTT